MKECGIYFCMRQGVVVYIGQTTDLVNRMVYHKTQLLDHDAVRFIPCDERVLDFYEKRWIKKFKPVENTAHKGRKKQKIKYFHKLRSYGAPRLSLKNLHMKFRIMTEKSLVGFGRFSDMTVGRLLTTERIIDVIHMYFGLSHISFCDELLTKLKITEEWRIHKPGVHVEKGRKFCNEIYSDLLIQRQERNQRRISKRAKREIHGVINACKPSALMAKNHGHFK